MNYSQPRIEYLSELSAYIKKLELLEEQKKRSKKKDTRCQRKIFRNNKKLRNKRRKESQGRLS
jgi:hypothetical protein